MKEKMMRYVIDFNNPPSLTKKQRTEIKALKNLKDEDIDLSDIPELSEQFWNKAKPLRDQHFYRTVKESTTLRLDTDVLAWLKSAGPGYQTRINAILRQVMLKGIKK